ncbi:MAG: DUF3108 domain-containing protein, partial [Candidatus Omnitrophica bacterium]|nr:DUF3108 domain-containing protein [Candidatus Omnitrophota bacterium]
KITTIILTIVFYCTLVHAVPFTKGEKFIYDVKYKGLKVGRSILTFHGEEKLGDKKAYHITFSTNIPSLKDTEELYADKDTFLPIQVHRAIKKKLGFGDRIKEVYDQENFRVDVSSKSKLRTKRFSIQKDRPIHNAILLAYYYRVNNTFNKGDKFNITLPTFDFEVTFNGIEAVKTPLGEFQAYTFTSDPPKFKLWLSLDERKIPLKIENPSMLGYSLVIRSID